MTAAMDTGRGVERVSLRRVGQSSTPGNGGLFRVEFSDRPKPRRLSDGSRSAAGEYPEIVHVTGSALALMEQEGRYQP